VASKDDDHQPGGFAHLGPAWLSAIAALISALAAVGFFAGRATAPESGSASGAATSPTQTTASTASTPSTASTASTDAPAVEPTPGQRLTHYTVDLPPDYGMDISDHRATPVSIGIGCPDITVATMGRIDFCESSVRAARLNASAPTYQGCLADTRFSDIIWEPNRGDIFCVTGHGYIAGVKVTADVVSLKGSYYTFNVTVWKAP
jgi:hypothetical protein